MTIRRKKKRHLKARTRDLIVDEAEKMIAKRGIDGLVLDEIAKTLGIQRPSLYTHFKGRDGILTAVAERAFIQLSHQFQDDENPDPVVTVSKGVDELVNFLVRHKAYARLLARDFSTPGGLLAVNTVLGPPESVLVPSLLQPLYDRLNKIFIRAHDAGRFRKMDPFVFLTVLLGSIMACLLQHRQEMENLNEIMINLAMGLLAERY